MIYSNKPEKPTIEHVLYYSTDTDEEIPGFTYILRECDMDNDTPYIHVIYDTANERFIVGSGFKQHAYLAKKVGMRYKEMMSSIAPVMQFVYVDENPIPRLEVSMYIQSITNLPEMFNCFANAAKSFKEVYGPIVRVKFSIGYLPYAVLEDKVPREHFEELALNPSAGTFIYFDIYRYELDYQLFRSYIVDLLSKSNKFASLIALNSVQLRRLLKDSLFKDIHEVYKSENQALRSFIAPAEL